jgi:hypothetical protein
MYVIGWWRKIIGCGQDASHVAGFRDAMNAASHQS